MKAVERGEVDKVAAVLGKKNVIPTKLDVEGRSAFHLAATRGHLDCLNLILGHNVDVTATDATGKNALHLASRNGHSLCVQKLLQHNCPVGNMDLQGRTALHDAVMAGCSSSVKLLCDSGASVNATDFDGKTPLVLATQMCHPHICQLLLERGADVTIRDKQNKTPLILGCEYGCKDAVEVLLKGGADVKVIDGLGHDAFHYARLSKNLELVSMVKKAAKEQWKRQDLERQNETMQESLRKYQQDQRALLEKVNMLQQQLTQKEQLKVLLSAKEDGARGLETVKVQLRSTLVSEFIHVGFLHSESIIQRPAMVRSLSKTLEKNQPTIAWDVSGELEALRHELETVKRRQQAAEEETARLQTALNRKNRECQELVQNRDTIQKQADRQVQELEDALGDVQKRMMDSECKVKQLQAHVVAVKEHLGGQATEELRAQLQDVKAKYEGASAEVGRVRNRLKQSEKALEEYKSSESQLASEAERLNHELGALTAERDELAETLFDNMKNLLTNAVDEKERQLAELREDYDRVLEEVAELHRKLDSPSSQGGAGMMSSEEQQRIQAALEEQNASLKRKLADVTAKSQYVPRQQHEQVKMELSSTLESVKAEMLKLEIKEKESREELKNVKEGNDKLKEELEKVLLEKEKDYIRIKDHKAVTNNLNAAVLAAENTAEDVSSKYVLAQEEIVKLTQELEAQTKELDTIQEAIQSKFIPLTAAEEKEHSYSAQVKELTVKMLEIEDSFNKERSARESIKQEKEKLNLEIESVQQKLDTALVTNEKRKEMEEEFKGRVEELSQRLVNLERQHEEVTLQKTELQDQNALCNTQIQNLQERLKSELVRIATYDTELKGLHDAMQQAQSDCKKAREAQMEETQKVCALQKELQEHHEFQASLLQQHINTKEDLEAELTKLRVALREEEENNAQRAEDVSALQSELLQATQALEDVRSKEDHMNQLKKEKQQLEDEAANLSNKLLSLTKECEEARQEAAQARVGESKARSEMEAVQEKGRAIEREIRELKERYDESLSTICDLQRRIQISAQQTEAKDKKITELLTDVERLKQALNGLSQLAYTSNTPNKRQSQHIETLQTQIKSLQQQLADAERQHREVVSIYRTHLLSAAQGHMDEDVQAALLQIIRMRQEFVC
uniref:Uveal autoantigen with coiled-coil domains and ankyrin repeats b n=1 Tax=Mastacembelus armatus TaxID=205130 RepID=A0A7N8YHZ6_9TELE